MYTAIKITLFALTICMTGHLYAATAARDDLPANRAVKVTASNYIIQDDQIPPGKANMITQEEEKRDFTAWERDFEAWKRDFMAWKRDFTAWERNTAALEEAIKPYPYIISSYMIMNLAICTSLALALTLPLPRTFAR